MTIGRNLAVDFAAELSALREQHGVTWDELARRSGVSRTYLRYLATGRDGHGLPSERVVELVAAAFEVEPDHFRITRARALLASPRVIDTVYAKLTKRAA